MSGYTISGTVFSAKKEMYEHFCVGVEAEHVKPDIILLVDNQLDTQFFSIIFLLESSTCFERLCAHPQEDNCMSTTFGMNTLC